MSPGARDTVAVGRVTRAHGIKGEVAVLVLSEVPGRFAPGRALRLEDGRTLTIQASRPHRGRLLVKFREVGGRDAAEALRNRYLLVHRSEVPDPPAGAFWPHQLDGCEVLTEGGRSLGRIAEVLPGPEVDLWAARDGGTERLIPALKDVVVSVDLGARRVVVREIPGLTTDEPT